MESARRCLSYTFENMYPNPKNIKNPFLVYLLNTIHLIGVWVIQFGIFFPHKYLKYYVFYLMIIFMSYFIFENQCFMSKISNFYSGKDIDLLCIKFNEAKFILLIYIFLGVIFVMEPSIAPYNLIMRLLNL